MEVTAKLISIGNASEGTSAKGPWRMAQAIFETQEQYSKTIAKIPLGSICVVKFDVSSREFNGKWYTNCKGYSIEVQGLQHYQSQPQQPSWDTPVPPLGQTEEEVDDLPF